MKVKSSHTFAYTIVKPFGWVRAQSANFFLGGFASFADSALRGSFELRGASAAVSPSVGPTPLSVGASPIACAPALRSPSTSWTSISPPSGRRLRSCRRGATAKCPARPMRAHPSSCGAVPLRQHYPPPARPSASRRVEPRLASAQGPSTGGPSARLREGQAFVCGGSPPATRPPARGFAEPAAPRAIVSPHCRCARRRARLHGQAAGPHGRERHRIAVPIAPCPCEFCELRWPRRTPSTLRCSRSTPS